MSLKQSVLTLVFLLITGTALATPLADGIALYKKGEYSNAYDQLRPLAKQGQGEAAYYVGMMYVDGLGVPQNSTNGVHWLELAVEYHHRDSAVMLGKMYSSGMGVPLDVNKAVHFLGLAEKLREPEDTDDCD